MTGLNAAERHLVTRKRSGGGIVMLPALKKHWRMVRFGLSRKLGGPGVGGRHIVFGPGDVTACGRARPERGWGMDEEPSVLVGLPGGRA